jgi:hypothetical protein
MTLAIDPELWLSTVQREKRGAKTGIKRLKYLFRIRSRIAGGSNELVKLLRPATNLQTGGVEKFKNRSPGELPKAHREFISQRNWLGGRIDDPRSGRSLILRGNS